MELLNINPADLQVSSDNVRTDVGDVKELAASIKSNGVLAPLLVRPVEGGYEIVAGHRRHAAALLAKVETVPVVVQERTDTERDEAMLIENLQRVDLSPVEEAKGYFRLVERGMKPAALSKRLGRSMLVITSRLALLELPDDLLAKIHAGELYLVSALQLGRAISAGVEGEALDELIADALEGEDIERNVDWAIQAANRDKIAAEIAAKCAKAKVGCFVRRGYQDRFEGLVIGTGYGTLDLDADAHKAEPCHVVYVDLTGAWGDEAPKTQGACAEPGRHDPVKGDSPLRIAKVAAKPADNGRVQSEDEIAHQSMLERNEARKAAQREALLDRMSAAEVAKMVLGTIIAASTGLAGKDACKLLKLEVVKAPDPYDSAKTVPDYAATLFNHAETSLAAKRRVAMACAFVALDGAGHRSPMGKQVSKELVELTKALLGEDPQEVADILAEAERQAHAEDKLREQRPVTHAYYADYQDFQNRGNQACHICGGRPSEQIAGHLAAAAIAEASAAVEPEDIEPHLYQPDDGDDGFCLVCQDDEDGLLHAQEAVEVDNVALASA